MTFQDGPNQASTSIGARSQILTELQPPLEALDNAQREGLLDSFDDYPGVAPRGVHPLDEPFDPNHPPRDLDAGEPVAISPAPAFNFRAVIFTSGVVLALLVMAWLRGAMGVVGGAPNQPIAAMVAREPSPPAPSSMPAQNQPAPMLAAAQAPAVGSLSPVSNAGPVAAQTAARGQAPLAQAGEVGSADQATEGPQVAPANPADLPAASESPPAAPSDDPSLNAPDNGDSSAGAPMNSAGSSSPPIAVIPLGPRPGQATTQRRGRTLGPAPTQLYEPRAQSYLDRANASRRLGDRAAAAADYRRAMDDFSAAATHGEDPYTAQSGLQSVREGLRLVGGR